MISRILHIIPSASSIWILIFFNFVNISLGQQRIAEKNRSSFKLFGDTTKVYYSSFENEDKFILLDSSLNEFEWVEYGWKDNKWYSDLGLLATPGQLMNYAPTLKNGFRVGLDQFERFRLDKEQLKFYQIKNNRPFTDLYYSQINQKNNIIKAEFAHAFNDRFYLGLLYDLTNQTGFFEHQRVRNQNVAVVARYSSLKKKYLNHLLYRTNAIKQENNGGVLMDSIIGYTAEFLQNLPVQTRTANSRYFYDQILFSQDFYQLANDSTGYNPSSYRFRHQISYDFNRFKYYDDNPDTDSVLYGIANVNPRGIRLFIQEHKLSNTFSFSKAIGGDLNKAPFVLDLSLFYDLNVLRQEPIDFLVHSLGAGIEIYNNKPSAFQYYASSKINYSADRFDFYVQGNLAYDFGKWGKIEANLLFQNYQPSLIDQQLYISWDRVWNNNFAQIQEISFGGSYANTKLGTKISVHNHTINNYVYYDSMAVNQYNKVLNLFNLKVEQHLKFWKIHLDNEFIWQPIVQGNEVFRRPQFLTRNNLYLQSYLFKKVMLAKLGVIFQYNSPYFADAYAPLTGTFRIQNRLSIDMEPRLDVYVAFRIWQFRFFVRAENLLILSNERNYFNHYRYPIHSFVVRFGISWRLFD